MIFACDNQISILRSSGSDWISEAMWYMRAGSVCVQREREREGVCRCVEFLLYTRDTRKRESKTLYLNACLSDAIKPLRPFFLAGVSGAELDAGASAAAVGAAASVAGAAGSDVVAGASEAVASAAGAGAAAAAAVSSAGAATGSEAAGAVGAAAGAAAGTEGSSAGAEAAGTTSVWPAVTGSAACVSVAATTGVASGAGVDSTLSASA